MVANGDPKVPEPKKEIMRNVLSSLNRFLNDRDWFAGAVPTIADFSILSNLIVILVRHERNENEFQTSSYLAD
jgi:glutathione S-transferase